MRDAADSSTPSGPTSPRRPGLSSSPASSTGCIVLRTGRRGFLWLIPAGLVLALILGPILYSPLAVADPGGVGAGPATGDRDQAVLTWNLMYVTGIVVQLAVGIGTLWALLTAQRTRRESQKREVSFSQEYVPARECHLRVEATDDRLARVERELVEVRSQAAAAGRAEEDRVRRIHERMDSIEKSIAQMPSQIVALLRNTGAIKT